KDGLAQASKDGLQFFNSLTGGSMPNLGLTLDGLFNASSKDGLGHSLPVLSNEINGLINGMANGEEVHLGLI
ncbi:MAG: hypothetical protein K6G79_07035, partial [Bacteroidales bacterium]|nr:hypothetical protein [Bacteroidales bacterium]